MIIRRKILTATLPVVVLVMVNIPSFSQQIPDSILKRITPPALGPNDTIIVPAAVHSMELIPTQTLEWIWVTAKYPKHLLEKRRQWTRLRNAVYVTYPYARKAGIIMNDMNTRLSGMSNKKERKKYIDSREKELKKEFADPLQELSIYQGKVLMKLINRQTGNNCYDLVKEYKGSFSARFWQTIAYFFNSSLKQPYNPHQEDKEMEIIVQEVERMYRM